MKSAINNERVYAIINSDSMTMNAACYSISLYCRNKAIKVEFQNINPDPAVDGEIYSNLINQTLFGPINKGERIIPLTKGDDSELEITVYKDTDENIIEKVNEFLKNAHEESGKNLTFFVEFPTDWTYIVNKIFKFNKGIVDYPEYVDPFPIFISSFCNLISDIPINEDAFPEGQKKPETFVELYFMYIENQRTGIYKAIQQGEEEINAMEDGEEKDQKLKIHRYNSDLTIRLIDIYRLLSVEDFVNNAIGDIQEEDTTESTTETEEVPTAEAELVSEEETTDIPENVVE